MYCYAFTILGGDVV